MQSQDKLPGITNYLMGSGRVKGPTNLPTYAKTRARSVYPGIDLVYYGTQGQLEYDFVLAPRADPSKIRLKFAGAKPVVDASGDLVLALGGKESPSDIRFRKPVLYQQVEGIRQPVKGTFIVAADHDEVRFQVGPYDHGRELVIDPELVFSSYLGGSSQQSVIYGIAVNAAGQIYVTGATGAINFPTTTGVIETTCPLGNTHGGRGGGGGGGGEGGGGGGGGGGPGPGWCPQMRRG